MPKTQLKLDKKIGLRPLMGYVLIEPSSAASTTASGIYLPDNAQEKPSQGTVIAIGPDIILPDGKLFASPVNIGDVVIYKKWGADEIQVAGVDYKLVKFEDLMGVLE